MNPRDEIDAIPDSERKTDWTRIDDEPVAAALSLIPGLLITGFYYFAFDAFGSTMLPSKICGAVTVLAPVLVLIHYVLNRRKRRFWLLGCASLMGMSSAWLLMGSAWFFYFAFAPMSMWIRVVALSLGGILNTYWMILAWRDYAQANASQDLEGKLFKHEPSRIVYSSGNAIPYMLSLKQREPFTRLHVWAVTTGVPIFVGGLLTSSGFFHALKGPHVVFLVLSFLTFPLSLYGGATLGMRTIFFEIYLPLKLERQTGKKVILGP
jgi:hypothetical protein